MMSKALVATYSALLGMFVMLIFITLLLMSGTVHMEQVLTYLPHEGSPAYNGADVGYLQDSNDTVDSVLSACNREHDGNYVRSRGKDRETGEFYRVTDYSANGDCEVNYTGRNLDRHEIREEGGDYTGYSYH